MDDLPAPFAVLILIAIIVLVALAGGTSAFEFLGELTTGLFLVGFVFVCAVMALPFILEVLLESRRSQSRDAQEGGRGRGGRRFSVFAIPLAIVIGLGGLGFGTYRYFNQPTLEERIAEACQSRGLFSRATDECKALREELAAIRTAAEDQPTRPVVLAAPANCPPPDEDAGWIKRSWGWAKSKVTDC